MRLAPPSPAAMSETDHQKLCVEYAEKIGLGPYLIAIPNGTQLPGGEAARARYMNHLKSLGLKPGASDLFLAHPVPLADWRFEAVHPKQEGALHCTGCDRPWRYCICDPMKLPYYHGAWFEMKRVKTGRTSGVQIAFLMNMKRMGYYVDVCAGFDEFRESLARYMAGEASKWPAP